MGQFWGIFGLLWWGITLRGGVALEEIEVREEGGHGARPYNVWVGAGSGVRYVRLCGSDYRLLSTIDLL